MLWAQKWSIVLSTLSPLIGVLELDLCLRRGIGLSPCTLTMPTPYKHFLLVPYWHRVQTKENKPITPPRNYIFYPIQWRWSNNPTNYAILQRNPQFTTFEPSRGDFLAVIHKNVNSSENSIQLPTPRNILKCIIVLKIPNNHSHHYSWWTYIWPHIPLTFHSSQLSKDQIQILTKNHPTHKVTSTWTLIKTSS